MVYKTRSCCAHGGLILYIHNELECTTLTDIDITFTGWKYFCIELCDRKPHFQKYTLCNVYRTMQCVQNYAMCAELCNVCRSEIAEDI